MSRTITPGQYMVPYLSDGTEAVRAGAHGVYTLAVGTYYIDLGGASATHLAAHFQWSSALIAVGTFWTSEFAAIDAPLISSTAGDWIQQNPSTAYVPIVGTGASVSNLTIDLAGGGAGGCHVNLSALASGRVRARWVVTTGGTLRTARYGKE